jgi:hypothetical protein
MKRCIFAVVVVFALLASATPAQSLARSDAGPVDYPVTGSFSGTGTFEIACGGYHQMATVTGDLAPFGTSTVAVAFCASNPPEGAHFPISSGSFTLSAADGTVSGSIGGFVQPGVPVDNAYPFQLVLTVTTGSGRYVGATGTITFDGAFAAGAQALSGTASGTVRFGSTTTPECKDRGWRPFGHRECAQHDHGRSVWQIFQKFWEAMHRLHGAPGAHHVKSVGFAPLG